MKPIYQILKLNSFKKDDFVKEVSEAIEMHLSSFKKYEPYDFSKHVLPLKNYVEYFYDFWRNSILNVNNIAEFNDYWISSFIQKFVDYVPSLYMISKMITENILSDLKPELKTTQTTEANSGQNTSGGSYPLDKLDGDFGLLGRVKSKVENNNIYRNIDYIMQYANNWGLQKWLFQFRDLFISTWGII